MDWSDLNRGDWITIAVCGVVGLYLAAEVPRMFRGDIKAAIAGLSFWAAALFLAVALYAYRSELGTVTERVMAVLLPGTGVETGPKEVTVFRQPDGQFVVVATVNGARVPFVLDTGASAVVVRAEDAGRLRIPTRGLRYDVEVSTANGPTLAAAIEIPRLSVGTLGQDHVPALLARPGSLRENLLGMSFLNGLDSFSVAKDRLVLHAR